jgi:hypothetical protein
MALAISAPSGKSSNFEIWGGVETGKISQRDSLQCWPFCAAQEEKTPGAQVPLSVPELRHLLTHLLWRGWHGVDNSLSLAPGPSARMNGS